MASTLIDKKAIFDQEVITIFQQIRTHLEVIFSKEYNDDKEGYPLLLQQIHKTYIMVLLNAANESLFEYIHNLFIDFLVDALPDNQAPWEAFKTAKTIEALAQITKDNHSGSYLSFESMAKKIHGPGFLTGTTGCGSEKSFSFLIDGKKDEDIKGINKVRDSITHNSNMLDSSNINDFILNFKRQIYNDDSISEKIFFENIVNDLQKGFLCISTYYFEKCQNTYESQPLP